MSKEIVDFRKKQFLYFLEFLKRKRQKTHFRRPKRSPPPSPTTMSGAETHKALKLATSPTVSANDSNKPQKKTKIRIPPAVNGPRTPLLR